MKKLFLLITLLSFLGINQSFAMKRKRVYAPSPRERAQIFEADKTPQGFASAMHIYIELKKLTCIENLVNQMVSYNVNDLQNVRIPNTPNYTLLHIAATIPNAEIFQYFVEDCGLDPFELYDDVGNTPFHIALEAGNLNVVRYILTEDQHFTNKEIHEALGVYTDEEINRLCLYFAQRDHEDTIANALYRLYHDSSLASDLDSGDDEKEERDEKDANDNPSNQNF